MGNMEKLRWYYITTSPYALLAAGNTEAKNARRDMLGICAT
ncbi:MAG: hypothetical protein ACREBB_11025 [Nitrosotalea sp.]